MEALVVGNEIPGILTDWCDTTIGGGGDLEEIYYWLVL